MNEIARKELGDGTSVIIEEIRSGMYEGMALIIQGPLTLKYYKRILQERGLVAGKIFREIDKDKDTFDSLSNKLGYPFLA